MASPSHIGSANVSGTWPRAGQDSVPAQKKGSTLPSPYIPDKLGLQHHRTEKKRHPVQRAPSRLYEVDRNNPRQDKYRGPTTCIGPEFVVRAANPPRVIHVGDVKPVLRRKLIVILLNGQKVEITCDPSTTTASQIFEVIVESEGISENFTLGLAMLVSGDFLFLPPEVRLHKMAPSGWGKCSQKNHPYYSFTLYLKIKFFLTPLRGFRSWSWKHLQYLQLRRCLLERQLRCETKDMMTLAGLALQAEFGDFNVEEHGCGDYFLPEHYLPEGMWREGEAGVVRELQLLHRERRGLDPGRAEEMFISYCQRLTEYGTHYYSAVTSNQDGVSAEVWLGVNGEGIVVCLKKACSTYSARMPHRIFKWAEIKKLSYGKQHFELTEQQDSYKHKFKMDSNKSFCVFRLTSLHHKFFLKYKSEMCSLQDLADEFGIPVKRNEKDSTKCVYYIGSSQTDVRLVDKTSLLRRSASFFSPDRVIFRGKTATHCLHKKPSYEHTESSKTDTESLCSSSTNTKSLTIPKQWTPNRLKDESESAPSSMCTVRRQDYVDGKVSATTVGRRGLGVRMGTRAFFANSQVDLNSSSQHNTSQSQLNVSLSSCGYSPPRSPLPEAYVLNSSIKSVDDHFHVDFQETISESLAEKFDNIPFVDERILTTVRLERDDQRGLGIQVTEGSDGGVYIQSIVPGGPAEKLGLIFVGDQIQAVNGQNILSMQYNDAVRLVASTPSTVELVLSQVNQGQEVTPPPHSSDYVPGETAGFDRSEMIPPVPAPRYKRKLITNEDSKHLLSKRNTCMNQQQTTEILPPPRRKRKLRSVNNTNDLIFSNDSLNVNKDSIEQNNTPNLKEVQTIRSGEQSPTTYNKSVVVIEETDPHKGSCLNLDEPNCSKMSDMTEAFSNILDSCILKTFFNNRVLDIPLESVGNPSFICSEQTSSNQDSDVDDNEENRVNSSLTENTATIVGVFYKPEYSLMKLVNGNNFSNTNVNNESDSTVWSCSFVNDGNKKNVVPLNEPVGKNIKISKKDSEEDDSGVFFSDTKSPSHRISDIDIANKKNTNEIDTLSDLQIYTPFISNDRDTYDNNSSESGPNMYNDVLDSFEAQTVSALREEVSGRLSLCSELSKNEAVESWLNDGDYPPAKKVINSNFSEYLRNMLEVEGSERSLSPYPLSTVDESSDVSEKGVDNENVCLVQSYTSEACTVPSTLSETRENRNVVFSDKYSSSFVDMNSVNYVNNECTEVTSCINESIFCSLEIPEGYFKEVETFSSVGQLRKPGENCTSQDKLFFKEAIHPESVSPSLHPGVVNKLITFFETVQLEEGSDHENESSSDHENESMRSDENSDVSSDIDMNHQDSFPCYNLTSNEIDNNKSTKISGPNENAVAVQIQGESIQNDNPVNQSMNVNDELVICENSAPKSEIDDLAVKCNHFQSYENESNLEINQCNLPPDEPPPIVFNTLIFEGGSNPNPVEDKFEQNNTCTGIKSNCGNDIEQDDKEDTKLSPPVEFADDNVLPVILDGLINEMAEINSKVPNVNTSTKDLLDIDDTFYTFKPTRIPIVILTEADLMSAPIGSVELHPLQCIPEDNDSPGMGDEIFKVNTPTEEIELDSTNKYENNESFLEDTITVVLEKQWGSIGLKIKGDAYGVIISDILVGGAADQSGQVFKGHLPLESSRKRFPA